MNLKIITAPIIEPILLAEAKLHLRVTTSADDTTITNKIVAARQHCENILHRSLASTTFELVMDEFPCGKIKLPMPPVESITSIKYKDCDGIEFTMPPSDYIFYNSEPAVILPDYGVSWPSFTPYPIGAVCVRFVAGYKAGTDANLIIPEGYKQAILLLIGHLYEHREEVSEIVLKNIPTGIDSLLMPTRIWDF